MDGIAALKSKAISLLPTICGLSPLEVIPVIEAAEKDLANAYYASDHKSTLPSLAAAQRTLEGLGRRGGGSARPEAHEALAGVIGTLSALQTNTQPEDSYQPAIKTLLDRTLFGVWDKFPPVFG